MVKHLYIIAGCNGAGKTRVNNEQTFIEIKNMNHKRILYAVLTLCLLSSCSVIRGLHKDGKDGPTTFSYQQRELDTIQIGHHAFTFASLPEGRRALDTMHICKPLRRGDLQTIAERMASLSPNQTILIIRNDTIIYEQSFGTYTPTTTATVFSVSKSITSLLCGIAADEGYINSIDDPVTKYLPELSQKHPYWQKLTIRHLLNMQSGIKMADTYSLNPKGLANLRKMADMEYSHNVMKLVKRLKFECQPGTKHQYRSIDTQVLGLVIERATHQPLAQLLSEKIWKPLGMERNAFITIDSRKHHHAHAFGGIATNALDLAKIGRLYLNGGLWNGRRIVSEEWIHQSVAYDTSNDGYHLCWYNTSSMGMKQPAAPGAYTAGIRGQILYINPAKHLIMVRLGANNYEYYDASWIFEEMAQRL